MSYREELLALGKASVRTQEIEVERLGGRKIRIRELNGIERDKVTNMYISCGAREVPAYLHEAVCTMGIVDEHSARVFNEEDAAELANAWGGNVTKKISGAIMDLSGMDDGEKKKKDSGSIPSADSGSDSPLPSDTL